MAQRENQNYVPDELATPPATYETPSEKNCLGSRTRPLFLLGVIWRIDLIRFLREPSTSRWLTIRRSGRSGPNPTVAGSRRLERRSDPMGVHFENKHGQAGFVSCQIGKRQAILFNVPRNRASVSACFSSHLTELEVAPKGSTCRARNRR
jgi:hypothetical protein